MITVTRCYQFSASHRLHIPSLSEKDNDALYGKCNNPYGHGHNYRLEVGVAGRVHCLTGQLLPLGRLDQLVQEAVISRFDHRYLNVDLAEFAALVPTTENVLVVVTDLLRQHWDSYIPKHAQLHRVHIQETDRNGFEALFPLDSARTRVSYQ